MVEVDQNTVDEIVESGRALIELCKRRSLDSMSTDEVRAWQEAIITHKVMLQELAGEL